MFPHFWRLKTLQTLTPGGGYSLTWDVDDALLGFRAEAEILLSKLWSKPEEGGEAQEEEEEGA
jgi:hypothetical protein